MTISHLLLLPIIIPALVGPLIVLLGRHDIFLSRLFSLVSVVCLLIVSGLLFSMSNHGDIYTYSMGNWASPFGIVLVLDRLSALMVGLSSIIGFGVLIYAIQGWDKCGKHFHTLFQLQIMGINGAFLTGDLFNLFVFFEVLLIASYGLMVHGGGGLRVQAGIQYVIINLVGSSFFLIATGLIYSVTGTLNMADMALKVSRVAQGDMAILSTGAILLLLVFLIKSALFPFHFWLPGTYSNTSAPVAALFALLTKVGAYCVLRVYVLIFPDLASPWILPLSLVTLVLGSLGVLASKTLGQMVSFYMIGSMGTLLIAFGQFTADSINAGLYYLLHSTLMASLLFLIIDLIRCRRVELKDSLSSSPPFQDIGLLGFAFFALAIGAIGMPPLSGFIGKLMILESSYSTPFGVWIWICILLTSFLTMIGFARAGSGLFWKSESYDHNLKLKDQKFSKWQFVPLVFLFSGILILTVFASPISNLLSKVTQQLLDSKIYTEAVIKKGERL